MKKFISYFAFTFLLLSCNNDDPADTITSTIDPAILGSWQVAYSQTIDSVKIAANDSLVYITDPVISSSFRENDETVTSFMFGADERKIIIKPDHRVKVYNINSQGGITITKDFINYRINNDLLIYHNGNNDLFHNYYFIKDTLVIRRIPDPNNSWRYKLSKYVRIEDFL